MMESYLSTVTDLEILLKQCPTTGVCLNTVQYIQDRCFFM